MCLNLPDEIVSQTGLTDRQLLVEVACWLFDRRRLDLWPAAQLAGMNRGEFESELRLRGIAVNEVVMKDVLEDLQYLRAKDGGS